MNQTTLSREQIAHRAFDNFPAAMMIVAPDGTVQFWNRAAEAVFGYRATEAEGQPIDKLIMPADRQAGATAPLEQAAATRSACQVSEYRAKDGRTLPLAVTVDAVAGNSGDVECFVLTPRSLEQMQVLYNGTSMAPLVPRQDLDGLTQRQREVLLLIAEGWSTRHIAQRLKLSVKTVETHRAHLMQRLRVDSVARLVRYAVSTGLVPATP